VGLNSLKSLNLTNVYPNNKNNKNKNNNKKKKNNKVKSKPLELYELAGKNIVFTSGDGKNHEWRRPRVVFGVPTSENNVFALLKQAQ
jgi:hypothetical protein